MRSQFTFVLWRHTVHTKAVLLLLLLCVCVSFFFPSLCQFIMAALMAPVPSLNGMQNVTLKLIMTFMSLCECCYFAAEKRHKKSGKSVSVFTSVINRRVWVFSEHSEQLPALWHGCRLLSCVRKTTQSVNAGRQFKIHYLLSPRSDGKYQGHGFQSLPKRVLL